MLGLRGKVLVAGGCFCEKNPEAAPCYIRASFRQLQRDLLLARVKPVSEVVCTSNRENLRKGKKNCQATAAGRARIEKVWEKQPCSPPGECSRRAGGAPGRQQQFPCGLCRELSLIHISEPTRPY